MFLVFVGAVESNLFQKHMVRIFFDLFQQQQQQQLYNYSSI